MDATIGESPIEINSSRPSFSRPSFSPHEQFGDDFSRSSPKLWISDGTIAGTTMLLAPNGADVRSGNNSSIEALTIVGDRFFFGAPTTVDANGYNDRRTLHALIVPEPTGAAAAVLAGLTLLRRRQRRSPLPPPSSMRRYSRRTGRCD